MYFLISSLFLEQWGYMGPVYIIYTIIQMNSKFKRSQ